MDTLPLFQASASQSACEPSSEEPKEERQMRTLPQSFAYGTLGIRFERH
jgi:hypothetical protein